MKAEALDISLSFIRDRLIPSLSNEKFLAICDSCGIEAANRSGKYQLLLAWGNAQNEFITDLIQLEKYLETGGQWLFGIFGYDLKGQLDKPNNAGPNYADLPALSFFTPQHVIAVDKNGFVTLFSEDLSGESIMKIASFRGTCDSMAFRPAWNSRTPKSKYISTVERIQEAIRSGDVYELNYCQEFYAQPSGLLNPLTLFHELTRSNPAPFSCYYRCNDYYLISSSPERFMRRDGNEVLCQPMKGTVARGMTEIEDQEAIEHLKNSEKDRSENVMIVDLVRNDLAQNCLSGSVEVTELFGVYSFRKVHQMISTIRAYEREGLPKLQTLLDSFPMGSMTGAPKYSVIKHIDLFEDQSRNWYSGSFGYIEPDGDFDFNVVIRSFLYNALKDYLSVSAGGAITIDSVAHKEYEESLLKAESLLKLINPTWSPLQDH